MNAVAIAILAVAIVAVVAAVLWGTVVRKRVAVQIDEARRNAERIVEDAKKSAESKLKEAEDQLEKLNFQKSLIGEIMKSTGFLIWIKAPNAIRPKLTQNRMYRHG